MSRQEQREAEKQIMAVIHERGLRTQRHDRAGPAGVICPCRLVRRSCPGSRPKRKIPDLPLADQSLCPVGERVMTGRDHHDAWYRDGELVAVAHYPYGISSRALRTVLPACDELEISMAIDSRYALHAPGLTTGVIFTRSGLYDVLYHPTRNKR